MITIGTKVAILPCDDYRNRFIGTQGIVQRYYHNKVGVKIDGCKNPESEFGVFWFREESLAVIPTNAIRDDAIRQIIFSGPKTIVIWSDGSKTIVSCSKDDTYDGYIGFCAAVAKKMFGSTSQVKKVIDKYIKIDDRNFWYDDKSPKKILYLCDGGQCETCSNECNHTTDIDHAKNFNKEFGVYVEKENNYAENQ